MLRLRKSWARINPIMSVDEVWLLSYVGEKLPDNSGLKMFDPLAEQNADGKPAAEAPPQPQNTSATNAAAAASAIAELDVELDETDFDVSNVQNMCKTVDDNLRLLAMSPWIRVIGGMRATEENSTAQVCQLAGLYDNDALEDCCASYQASAALENFRRATHYVPRLSQFSV